MNVLMDRPRAVIVAVLAAFVGAAALFFGATAASAHHQPGDCTNATQGDVTTGVSGVAFVGLNQEQIGNVNGYGFWLCLVPPDQGGGIGFRDPNPTNPTGWGFEASTCGTVTCTMLASMTGAEVGLPSTTTTSSGATPGGSAGTGSGTCVYVNGTTPAPGVTCPRGVSLAGVNVATGDLVGLPGTHPNAGGCVTAAGDPCVTTVPSGFGVSVFKGDSTNDTVSTTVAGTPVSRDLGQCIGFNAGSGC